MNDILRYAVAGGTAAGITSAAALMALSRSRGRNVWQPLNATSHWLRGPEAAEVRQPDVEHTLPGAVTHQAASMFWGAVFGIWAGWRRHRSPTELVCGAAGVAALAAATDYGAMPRRLTPGWELVLPRSGVAAGFVAMAVGFAAAGLLVRRRAIR